MQRTECAKCNQREPRARLAGIHAAEQVRREWVARWSLGGVVLRRWVHRVHERRVEVRLGRVSHGEVREPVVHLRKCLIPDLSEALTIASERLITVACLAVTGYYARRTGQTTVERRVG